MKAGIIFGGTGPILILTSYKSFKDVKFVAKLASKGIKKFIASEIPVESVKMKYGRHFDVVLGDLKQSDDLRVMDYDGHNVFYKFPFSEMEKPVYHEV